MPFSASVIFRSIDQLTAPVRRMQASTQAFANSASMAFGRVSERSSMLSARMETLSSKMISFKSVLAGGAIFMAGKGLYSMALASAKASDEQIKFARRVDISLQSFKEMNYAANRSGIATEQLQKWYEKLERGMGHLKMNSGELYNYLAANDRAMLNNLKHAKNNEQAFDMIVNAVSRVKNPMLRATYTAAAFGEKASKMTNMLLNGTKGLEAMRAEYRKFGGDNANAAMSSENLIASQIKMNASFNSVKNAIGYAAIPAITRLMDLISEWMATNKKMIKDDISYWIRLFANSLFFVVKHLNVIMPLLMAYVSATVALKVATVAWKAVALSATIIQGGFNAALAVGVILGKTSALSIVGNARAFAMLNGMLRIGTAVQWLFNASLYGCPVVWIIAAIIAVVAAIVLLVKHWKEITDWVTNSNNIFAVLIRASLMPVILYFKAMGFVFSWLGSKISDLWGWFKDTKVFKVFAVGFKFAFDVVSKVIGSIYDKIKSVFAFIYKIIKFVGSPILQSIKIQSDYTRDNLKSMGIGGSSEKPVNKDMAILTQKKIIESNSSQKVQISIDDPTGRSRITGQTTPIPILVNSTRKFP